MPPDFLEARSFASRRDFLSGLGGGFGLLALQALERNTVSGQDLLGVGEVDPLNPYLPRKPDFTPRAKSVIFQLW